MMRKKDRKWLEHIALMSGPTSAMYEGLRVDFLPSSVARRLAPFIDLNIPHNPSHKERWTINQKGRDMLARGS